MSCTRTIRLRVKHFETEDWKTLARDLYGARHDLTFAANQIMTRLFCGTRKELGEKPPSQRTYCYQLMTGKCGEKVYEPKHREVSGGVKSAAADKVHKRYSTDYKAVWRGDQSLPTFRELPIPFRAQEVKIIDPQRIRLLLWAGRSGGSETVVVEPQGRGHEAVWRRIRSGEYRHGSAELTCDRKNRWFLNLSYTYDPVPFDLSNDRLLGVDLGIINVVACVVHHVNEERFTKYAIFGPPDQFWRMFRREQDARREVGRANRAGYDQRSGRGRARKIRPLDKRSEKHDARRKDIIRKVSKVVVDHAVKHGCGVIVIEDLSEFPSNVHDEAEERVCRGSRAWYRKRFLRFNQGALLVQIKAKCEEVGIVCIEVDPIGTSKMCSTCGKEGKRRNRSFHCECGTWTKNGRCDADLNAARNIALRGKREITK